MEIVERHCTRCGRPLRHNGSKDRTIVLPNELGTVQLRLHRKRCKWYGEAKVDLAPLVSPRARYHEDFRRVARQLHANDLIHHQVRQAVAVFWEVKIPHSTVVAWLSQVAAALREVLATTPLPTSGVWEYDEVFLWVGGSRAYDINLVDYATHFVHAALDLPTTGKMAGREALIAARHGQRCDRLDQRGRVLVMDGTANLGGLFHSRPFKHFKIQRCGTQLEWTASTHVKQLAGQSVHSKKPVKPEWRPVLQMAYRVIDAPNEAEYFAALGVLRGVTTRPWKKTRKARFDRFFRALEASRDKIQACREDPRVPATNNHTERFQQWIEAYPTLKRRMMTAMGAQREVDYRVFTHNLGQFPRWIARLERKRANLQAFHREKIWDRSLSGATQHINSQLSKTRVWGGRYKEIWAELFQRVSRSRLPGS